MKHPFSRRGTAAGPSQTGLGAGRPSLRQIRFGIQLASLSVLGLVACREQAKAPASQKPRERQLEVRTLQLAAQTAVRRISIVGSFSGAEEVTVSTQVSGTIERCALEIGDACTPGDVLAQIDATDYQIALAQARGELAEVFARLGGGEDPLAGFQASEFPAVKRAAAELEFAEFDYERLRGLQTASRGSNVSLQELNDAQMRVRVAEANLRTARDDAEALVAQAIQRRSAVELAEWKLSQTTVRVPPIPSTALLPPAASTQPAEPNPAAPVWHVAERLVTEGQYVSVGAQLYRLVISDPLKLLASVPERYIGQVEIGTRVEVRGPLEERPFAGQVVRVRPTVDPQTRTFDIEVLVHGHGGSLKAGSFGKADVLVESARPLLLVPETALQRFAGVTKAFVVEDGTARERELLIGERFGNLLEVRDGLASGEAMVADPSPELTDGLPVRVRPDSATAIREVPAT